MGLDVRTRWEDMSDAEPQNSLRPGKPLSWGGQVACPDIHIWVIESLRVQVRG